MKRNSLPALFSTRQGTFAAVMSIMFAFLLTVLSVPASAQGNQLSLADILIGLRSKKASLPDRNKILTDAIATRGTTFTLTPEIEKELSVTGADRSLLESIRQRGQIARVASSMPPAVDTRAKTDLPR